jgi:hypothetical protein
MAFETPFGDAPRFSLKVTLGAAIQDLLALGPGGSATVRSAPPCWSIQLKTPQDVVLEQPGGNEVVYESELWQAGVPKIVQATRILVTGTVGKAAEGETTGSTTAIIEWRM